MTTPMGAFIVFEGIDGSGKSTQVRRVAKQLDALATFEPGATVLGQSLRKILLDGSSFLAERAEALLMAADRAQHVAEIVEPALASGRDVVSDRFLGSTLAYQGYGRGLDLEELQQLCNFATGGLTPDLVILMDIDPAVAASRGTQDTADRFEQSRDFQERVRDGFLELARKSPAWVLVNAQATRKDLDKAVDAALATMGH